MRTVKAFVAVTLMAALPAIGADAAVAGTIKVQGLYYKPQYLGDGVFFRAAPGEDNALTIVQEAADVVVVTDRVPLLAGSGCVAQADASVRCSVNAGFSTAFDVRLGDGDDEGRLAGVGYVGSAKLSGGPGDDHLVGFPDHGTAFYGGPGNDVMVGGSGSDQFQPSRRPDGSDTFIGGSAAPDAAFPEYDSVSYSLRREGVHADLAADRDDGAKRERDLIGADIEIIEGSGAADVLIGGPNSDHLDGYDGGDLIRGGGGADNLVGDGWVIDRPRSEDEILGGTGNDVLSGGAGGDLLTGGPGDDTIYAGPGPDRVRTRDDAADTVICGPGRDLLLFDTLDFPRPDCERKRAG